MAGKGFGLYDKTITVRVNAEQYERYKEFCLTHRVQLNELVRFLLDRVVCGEDEELMKILQQYESIELVRTIRRIFNK